MNTIDFLPLIGLSENETKNRLSTLLNKNEFPELDEDGLSLKSEGIILFFDENRRVNSVAFFCADNADYYEFQGLLPNGINFGDSAETVEEKLGEPSRRSKGRTTFKDHGITVPRTFPSFFTAYHFNGISWLFSFNEFNQLIRLSIGCADSEYLKLYPNFSAEYLNSKIVRDNLT